MTFQDAMVIMCRECSAGGEKRFFGGKEVFDCYETREGFAFHWKPSERVYCTVFAIVKHDGSVKWFPWPEHADDDRQLAPVEIDCDANPPTWRIVE